MEKINIFWFRRDLRLEDNAGLAEAFKSGRKVLPLFIFDTEILEELPFDDRRVNYIHSLVSVLAKEISAKSGKLSVKIGKPEEIFRKLLEQYDVAEIFACRDYEPYAIDRDSGIEALAREKGSDFKTVKDSVIFEKGDILKKDGTPYTVFTPYKNKAYAEINRIGLPKPVVIPEYRFTEQESEIPALEQIGFQKKPFIVPDFRTELPDYETTRDYPAAEHGTTRLSVAMRFGTIGIRTLFAQLYDKNPAIINELFWREFFMAIITFFPETVKNNFKRKFDAINTDNNIQHFERWKQGKTGYPIVDAGMRELNETGYMHNRARMITASFLCKHLLIDWRWGEAYFAEKLMDFELSSNVGNWQWAAGTGCDAAPYFRVFNPFTQQKKFDKDFKYIKQYVPEFGTDDYPEPIISHEFARKRALARYKDVLEKR